MSSPSPGNHTHNEGKRGTVTTSWKQETDPWTVSVTKLRILLLMAQGAWMQMLSMGSLFKQTLNVGKETEDIH